MNRSVSKLWTCSFTSKLDTNHIYIYIYLFSFSTFRLAVALCYIPVSLFMSHSVAAACAAAAEAKHWERLIKLPEKTRERGGKKAWLSLFTAAQHNVTFQNKTNVFEPQCSDRLIFAVNNTSRLQPRQFKRRTLLEVGHKNVDSKIFSGVLL